MALRTGRYRLGPDDGTVLIKTRREGAAGMIGHDLTLLATRWAATVSVDAEVPARSTLKATVEARSIVVREASGGAIGLTESQKEEIENNLRSKVLHSDRHPSITFKSTAVESDAKRGSVTGDLTIGRRTRAATLELRVAGSKVPRITGTTSIVQTEFGIKPYSALFGALRVKDVVELVVEVRLPDG